MFLIPNTEMDQGEAKVGGRRKSGHVPVFTRSVWTGKGTVSTKPKVGSPTEFYPSSNQNQNKQSSSAVASKHFLDRNEFKKKKKRPSRMA